MRVPDILEIVFRIITKESERSNKVHVPEILDSLFLIIQKFFGGLKENESFSAFEFRKST